MSYMLNFNVCEISPLLFENVALRMGNLQVIKIRCWFCCCKWLPLTVSLGALLRNRMWNLVNVFYSLRIYLWDFMNMMLSILMRFYVEAFVTKLLKILELNSATKRFKNLLRYFEGEIIIYSICDFWEM